LFVQKVHHPDEALPDEADEDLVVMATQDESNLNCPITRSLLKEPVKKYHSLLFYVFRTLLMCLSVCRSQVCGHIYSKEAIQFLLQGKRKTKCPVAGCAADVSNSSLEIDREVSYRVEREEKRSHKRKKKAQNEEYTQV